MWGGLHMLNCSHPLAKSFLSHHRITFSPEAGSNPLLQWLTPRKQIVEHQSHQPHQSLKYSSLSITLVSCCLWMLCNCKDCKVQAPCTSSCTWSPLYWSVVRPQSWPMISVQENPRAALTIRSLPAGLIELHNSFGSALRWANGLESHLYRLQ